MRSGSRSWLAPRRCSVSRQVLFLIDELCSLGGAEGALLRTVRLLPPDRYQCLVATFRVNPKLEILGEFPCPLHVFPLRKTYDWNALRTALRLRRLIRSENVAIVHSFFETSDLWGGPVAKLSGCRVLVSSRRDMGILRSPKHRFAYRVLSPLFDQVQTVSEEVRRFSILEDGLDPGKVVTLYNGIDVERIAAANGTERLRASLDLGGASPLVVTVGGIRRVKGMDIFIRAAALVCKEFPRAAFLVAGEVREPEHFQELQRLARELGVASNVRFLGACGEVFSLLKMCDVFCLTSRSEGFSNALLEAMACGLPCIATRVGGNGEALEEGRSGFLTPSESPQIVAERILTLLRQPALARDMGRAARETVAARFTDRVMIEELVKLYDRLLD